MRFCDIMRRVTCKCKVLMEVKRYDRLFKNLGEETGGC